MGGSRSSKKKKRAKREKLGLAPKKSKEEKRVARERRLAQAERDYPNDPNEVQKIVESFGKDNEKRIAYLLDYCKFHDGKGIVDQDELVELRDHVIHARKMNRLSSWPIFQGEHMENFVQFAISAMHKDSPFPESMRKDYRMAMQEIMGPDVTFDKKALPDDYVPSWKRGEKNGG